MRALAAMLASLAAGLATVSASAEDLVSAIKATYLYKLAPFVVWPSATFSGPEDAFVICVQGREEFAGLVTRAATGQRVSGHSIIVRCLTRIDRASGCELAYLGGSAAQTVSEALAALDGAPVLTVTDAAPATGRGVVNFVLEGGRVRFSIDPARAGADGLGVSSKLLALAVGGAR